MATRLKRRCSKHAIIVTFSHYVKRLGRDVSVDERLVAYKGRHESIQYMANKTHPWGIKFWLRADPRTGYTHGMIPYRYVIYT